MGAIAPARLCWNQPGPGLWQGPSIPCSRVGAAARGETGMEQEGLCGLGEPVPPGCANPARPPAQHPAARTAPGAGGVWGALPGQRVLVPLQHPGQRWPWRQQGQPCVCPDALLDQIPGCRLCPSFLPGCEDLLRLAGCPGPEGTPAEMAQLLISLIRLLIS